MKREPLLVWSSTLVGLQILTGGAALGDLIGLQLAGFFVLVVAALQGGTQFYVRGQVTPSADVAVERQSDGALVAGPASPLADGQPVAVSATGPPPGGDSYIH